MKKFFTLFVVFVFPSFLMVYLLKLMGHKVHKSSKIGFCVIWVNVLVLGKNARIGHFNIVKCDELNLDERAYLGKFNAITGNIDIILAERGAIGNFNMLSRAPLGVTYGKAVFKLGILSKLTGFHKVDLTRSVIVGDYSTFAGQSSQIWTHGYYHHRNGPGRFRVDGEVYIGNNVYIGSACLVNAGVKIADGITVGSNSTVSKSLNKPGVYVSQPLRYIESDPLEVEKKLKPVTGYDVCEIIYEKEL
jgi:acetyltransferase-like isoleucine patch superfamily enzyme